NYLTPFFDKGNFLGNHFESDEISTLLASERTDKDTTSRMATIAKVQQLMAEKYLSTVPLLQGSQVAVARDGVSGVKDTLNASFQFRYAVLTKG
ncbi:MAG: peptide ABC transporter substrate-binding protein, partial [Cellulomonas sp.]|nr:peptide ABC transporter substrate-binding protein [Cellulomonas sp.]